jgi:subtilisin-like proprotein convertase family protein
VTKLDAATGSPIWARGMGGTTGSNSGLGVVPDSLGNVYVTGRFSATPTSSATFGSFSLTSKSNGGTNAFVTRLDSSGNFQWARRMGGADNSSPNQGGYGIAIDDRAADSTTWAVYVTGIMNGNSCDFGSTTFKTGGDDAFVTRMDATTGSFTWADQLGGAGQELAYAIALDGSGNVYTVGGFGNHNQSANFDPHGTFLMYPGDGLSTASGNPPGNYSDGYVSLLDSNGHFLAAWQTKAQQAYDHNGIGGIAADSTGDVWVSGGFDVTTAFPNGQTLTTNGTGWVFVMRLNVPVVGTVYADLNKDGTRVAEPPLVGRTVYVDLNNSGSFVAGDPSAVTDNHGNYAIAGLAPGTYTIRTVLPAGWTTTAPAGGASTVTVGNGFVRGPDFGEYTPTTPSAYTQSKPTAIKTNTSRLKGYYIAQSTLSVSDSYSALDVDVNVNISYSLDSNLSVYLIAPDGTMVPLALNNGGGANFTNTTFDDEAAAWITSGSAPFSGSYQPQSLLAALQGKIVKGTWTLEVINGSLTVTGTINSWSLIVTHATSSPQLSARGVAPGG